jgi:hypothetical protein
MPAATRFTGHGHLLIPAENGAAAGARCLLQALTLRLAVATRPGTMRFGLADPLGQGEQLSGFLRLPAEYYARISWIHDKMSIQETAAAIDTLTSLPEGIPGAET